MTAHPGELNHDLREIVALRQRLAEVEQVASLQADYIRLLEGKQDAERGGSMLFPWEIFDRQETDHPSGQRLIDLGVETTGGTRFKVSHLVQGPDEVGQRGVTMMAPWP